MNVRFSASVLVLCASVIVAGCASPRETNAFRHWVEADPQRVTGVPADAARISATDAANQAVEAADVDQLVALAWRENPSLRAAYDRWKQRLERVPQSRSLEDPRLRLQHDTMDDETGVGVMQMLPWPQKLDLAAEAALEEAHAAQKQYEQQRLLVAARVHELVAELYYLQQAQQLLATDRDQLRQIEEVALSHYSNAHGPQYNVVNAQIEIERAENQLENLRKQEPVLRAQLNEQLGLRPEVVVTLPAELEQQAQPLAYDALRVRMLAGNPTLAALRHEAASARTQVKLARLGYVPDLELGYMRMWGRDGMEGNSLQVGVTLPLWVQKKEARISEMLAAFSASTHELTQQQLMLESQLQKAVYELDEARRRATLYQERLLPRARLASESLRSQYEVNEAPLDEVIQSQRVLIEFQLNNQRALADIAARTAQINALLGEAPGTQTVEETDHE